MPSHCECACDSYKYFVDNCEISEAEKGELQVIAEYLGDELREVITKIGYGDYIVEVKYGNKLVDAVNRLIVKKKEKRKHEIISENINRLKELQKYKEKIENEIKNIRKELDK